jgi:hypothetical protein
MKPAEGEAPAIITSHGFQAREEWWTVCAECGLAESAHAWVQPGECDACGADCEPGERWCGACDR